MSEVADSPWRAEGTPTENRARRPVLITGGCGYIGSMLVRRLLAGGYWVRVVDSCIYDGEAPLRELMGHPRFSFLRADITEPGVLEEATLGVSSVVHLAAVVGDPACALRQDLAVEVNLNATRRLVDLVDRGGVGRLIFASTCSVYGASEALLTESSLLNPLSLYAMTKVQAEEAALSLARGACAVVVRFATAYGLSPRPRFDLVVNLLTAQAVGAGTITIFGGQQWRPFIHASDAAAALHALLEAPATSIAGQIFNVGSEEQNYRIQDVADIIARLVPGTVVNLRESDQDSRNYRVSFAKLHSVLRFEPKWDIPAAVGEIRDALLSRAIADYREPRYSNLESFQIATPARVLSS